MIYAVAILTPRRENNCRNIVTSKLIIAWWVTDYLSDKPTRRLVNSLIVNFKESRKYCTIFVHKNLILTLSNIDCEQCG